MTADTVSDVSSVLTACEETGARNRGVLVKEMGFRTRDKAEYVVITGCRTSERVPEGLKALQELLDMLRVDYTLLPKESCCGFPVAQPAVVSKDEAAISMAKEVSRKLILRNFRQAEALGARSIVLFCSACEPLYTHCAKETGLEVISYSELLDRCFGGGKLDLEVDYYTGCYRFRRRLTAQPVDVEPALRVLRKIEGLRVNCLDGNLCCHVPPQVEQLLGRLTTNTLVNLCNGCCANLRGKLEGRKGHRVVMLPELVLQAVKNG